MRMDLERMSKSVEVNDNHILLGEPIVLRKYGKDLTIRQLNWYYEWDKFSGNLMTFLMYYNQIIEGAFIPDNVDELSSFRDKLKLMLSKTGVVNKAAKGQAWKAMCNICKLSGASVRWMRKRFSLDDWIELFMYFYLYNVVGKKKGLRDVFTQVGIHQLNWSQLKPRFTSGSKKATP
jgi:hypothetical protein